jgi:hypothetical protein
MSIRHAFWGRTLPSRPLQRLAIVERPPAIKSAKSEKVPVMEKSFFPTSELRLMPLILLVK